MFVLLLYICGFLLLAAHCLFHQVHPVLRDPGRARSSEGADQTGALPDAGHPA